MKQEPTRHIFQIQILYAGTHKILKQPEDSEKFAEQMDVEPFFGTHPQNVS